MRELKPNDDKKSFYGKAEVKTVGELEYLYSYGTLVMVSAPEGLYRANRGKLHDRYHSDLTESKTTLRHVKAFSGLNKKEYISLPDFERRAI